jgi:hypothetical protein
MGDRGADPHHRRGQLEAVQRGHHGVRLRRCASDSRVHFGLGASKIVREIDIKWPSRIHQVLHNVAADQILAIEEPAQ